jgi:glucose-6-phosphate 1-epimerase
VSGQPRERLAADVSAAGARWIRGPGDLPFLAIDNERCRALFTPYGGQLCEWAPAAQAEPVVLRSPHAIHARGKAIRGGVPICFPWFGDHPRDRGKPAHGFARTREWQVAEVVIAEGGAIVVRMHLDADAETRALWRADFAAELAITLGESLALRFAVDDRGADAIELEVALHAYFGVGDVEAIRLHGLTSTRFVDKVDGGTEKTQGAEPLAIRGEVDRVFLGTSAPCEIEDPVLGRRIRIEKSGSLATVVWNPGAAKARTMADVGDAWPRFVCVETACVGPHAVRLEPGGRHVVEARVSVAGGASPRR